MSFKIKVPGGVRRFFCALSSCLLLSAASASFSLTADEMVFASKLSDENRHLFCEKFSSKERFVCVGMARGEGDAPSHDEIVGIVAGQIGLNSEEKGWPR